MTLYMLDGNKPEIVDPDRCWVADNAQVIGKVRLEQDATVWFGAVLRGDNELISVGAGSNVQDMCVLHTDMGFPLTIGAGCTLGHSAIVHGCMIGENSLIGMGATILNGVRIGRNCIIGANALIPEGKEIPDNSLVVGMPGKVIRELDDASAQNNRRLAAHYVENGRRYASGLVSL
ncbi:gamma carbonic anhydrase family protein [Coralliovum pocilloporae]|uniref:gamma carbonic anhydrase family protein n=1 Tax=Coralliovum pocilloporae TaxID=3066369 RepID=UPI003306B703